MKHPYYDYMERNFQDSSPLISDWVEKNGLSLFDYDNCYFGHEHRTVLVDHLKWIKNTAAMMIVVESHPYFEADHIHQERNIIFREIADDLNLKYGFFCADYNLWLDQNDTTRTFHPAWYFRQRKWAKDNQYPVFNFTTKRKYNFACGNKSNYRLEKIYNYIECYRRHRIDWLVTLYNHEQQPLNLFEYPGPLSQEQVDLWNNEIRPNARVYEHDYDPFETSDTPNSTLFPVHTDSYCNLVMEHSMEIAILSEKSYKPFLAKQIPVYLANIRAAEALNYLGFDLFYDFIDHTKYDTWRLDNSRLHKNFTMRIDRVHELIDELYQTDFTHFFHLPETQARLQANQDYFYSDAIDKLCIKHFDQLLDKY